jgi:DNA repair protein RadC
MMGEMAAHDRPREKLETHGASALGDNELLSVLIGHGSAGRGALALANLVLVTAGGLRGLTRLDLRQLAAISGIGPAQAGRIQAAIELGRRTLRPRAGERPQFRNAVDIARFLLPQYGAHPVERFGVMLLDTKYRLLGTRLISVGSLDSSTAHPRDVFREALLGGAAAVVVFHNHPSGDPSPSRDDLRLTARLADAGAVVGCALLDHVILADESFYSLRERGHRL